METMRPLVAENTGPKMTVRSRTEESAQGSGKATTANPTRELLALPNQEALKEQYLDSMSNHLALFQLQEQWDYFPDLYAILQNIVLRSSLEVIVGSKVFEVYPDLVNDIRLFIFYTPKYLQRFASWRYPEAFQVRSRLLQGIKSWHQCTNSDSDSSKIGENDPTWEPYLGSKLNRARYTQAANMHETTLGARAADELGLMYT
jgi:hypothetical protein